MSIELEYELILGENNFPYKLLLLADESISQINKYVFESKVYTVKIDNKIIGAFCLYQIDENTIELKNIAISESFQNKGIGSKVISHIKEICMEKYSTLIVGTADCGTNQIRFYERHGFQKYDSRKNFFIENYAEPIFENGVQLVDMVLLKYSF